MIKEWTEDVQALAKIAEYDPQLVYTAYVFGTSKRWQYVCRTTPKISVLKKLEEVIKSKLIPKIIGKEFSSDKMRAHEASSKIRRIWLSNSCRRSPIWEREFLNCDKTTNISNHTTAGYSINQRNIRGSSYKTCIKMESRKTRTNAVSLEANFVREAKQITTAILRERGVHMANNDSSQRTWILPK